MQDKYLFPFSSIITLIDPNQIDRSRSDTSAARFEQLGFLRKLLQPKQVDINGCRITYLSSMYIYLQSVCFHGLLYCPKLSKHGQIWYHLIDNFMRNNFGEKYFMHVPLFLKKIEKTVKSNQQEPPKCGSTRSGAESFLPRHQKTILNTFMQ